MWSGLGCEITQHAAVFEMWAYSLSRCATSGFVFVSLAQHTRQLGSCTMSTTIHLDMAFLVALAQQQLCMSGHVQTCTLYSRQQGFRVHTVSCMLMLLLMQHGVCGVQSGSLSSFCALQDCQRPRAPLHELIQLRVSFTLKSLQGEAYVSALTMGFAVAECQVKSVIALLSLPPVLYLPW
jgi:hypothetical protein